MIDSQKVREQGENALEYMREAFDEMDGSPEFEGQILGFLIDAIKCLEKRLS